MIGFADILLLILALLSLIGTTLVALYLFSLWEFYLAVIVVNVVIHLIAVVFVEWFLEL